MPPETLGPYRIDREIGVGGMGKVYAATLTREAAGLAPGTTVALKVVHPHLLETEGFFRRFLREAEIGASVRHENVVRTYLGDSLSGYHFLVMEYVEGQTLAALQHELDKVPEELCRHVAREVCKALGAIHAAGVVHRDLKPENVIVATREARRGDDVAERATGTAGHNGVRREGNVQPDLEYVVKVMDLGVARLVDETIRLSQTGAFVGSVEYAAPEQFKGTDVDARTDLYALGVLLYEIASGTHPHRGGNSHAVLRRVLSEQPRPLGEVNPQVSPFFEELVHTLLVKDPRGRFASAAQLLAVLGEGEDSDWWQERSRAMRAETKRPLRRSRIPRETAVYGRERDIAKLRALYEQARSGHGQVVLIEGEAGIGKSRLVDELVGRLQSDGEDLNFLFGGYPPGGAASAAGGFSAAYREHFGEAGSAEHLAQTPLLVPGFDAVLRGEPAPTGVLDLNKDSLATCFVHATRSLAAERTTVVLIDDLHFAPEEARALFAALALAVPDHRVLLIGTARPGLPDGWIGNLSRLDHATHMAMARLGPKDLMGLLEDAFSSEQLALDLCGQVALKSDGNPFFALEIIRGLREGQFIAQNADGTWSRTQVIEDIRVPSSVLDLVNARVSGLSEEERDLLDVACCGGFEFDPLLVGDVLGIARIPLLKRLGQIERQHRLVRSAGLRYVFDHHQVQEALYGSLSELLRREYHAAFAKALETRSKAADTDPATLDGALCVDLCDHYLEGARGASALRYLPAAQTHLSKSYLHAQTAALAERALAVPDLLTGTERAKALLRLADALNPMGRRARQEECAREAERLAEEAGDDELRGHAATALGTLFGLTSRHTETEAAYRRALDLARRTGDQVAEVNAMRGLEFVAWVRGEYAVLENLVGERLGLARTIGYEHGTGTFNLGAAFASRGRYVEAEEHYAAAASLFHRLGDRHTEVAVRAGLGSIASSRGRLREAREHWERWLALSRAIGDRAYEAHAQRNLGGVLREEGDGAAAKERLVLGLSLSEEIGDRRGMASTQLALGSLRAAAGSGVEARQSLAAARDLAADVGIPGIETLARCELACLPGADATDGLAAVAEHESRLSAEECREARWLLFRATGDRAHLIEAKRLLDESVAHLDDETKASMLTNLRVNREIMAAWRGDGDLSETRAG